MMKADVAMGIHTSRAGEGDQGIGDKLEAC